MGEHDSILQQQWLLQLDRARLTEKQIAFVKEKLQAVDDVMESFRAAAAHIKTDERLSTAGKQGELGSPATQYEERLGQIVNFEKIDKEVADAESYIKLDDQPSDPVVLEMTLQERRSLLYQKYGDDEVQVEGLYLELATSGKDDLTMIAIETAPISFPLLKKKDIIKKGKEVRAERQNPQLTTAVQQLVRQRAVLAGRINAARSEMGLDLETSLQRMANGEAMTRVDGDGRVTPMNRPTASDTEEARRKVSGDQLEGEIQDEIDRVS